MIYVVLGMHKSGTTMISEMLHESGINMVDNRQADVGYYDGNKMEREAFVDINHALLQSRGVYSLDIDTTISIERPTPNIERRIESLISDCNDRYGDWGVKDPRACITYPVWRRYLPEHRLIYVFRNPIDVAHHYYRLVDGLRKWRDFHKSLESWKRYNELALDHIRTSGQPSIVVDYDDYLSPGSSLAELSAFVGVDIADTRSRSGRTREMGALCKLLARVDALKPRSAVHQHLRTQSLATT